MQLAGQIDRRLGTFGSLGNGILTFAGYYQWLKEDAVVTLGPENFAPNTLLCSRMAPPLCLEPRGTSVSPNSGLHSPSIAWCACRCR